MMTKDSLVGFQKKQTISVVILWHNIPVLHIVFHIILHTLFHIILYLRTNLRKKDLLKEVITFTSLYSNSMRITRMTIPRLLVPVVYGEIQTVLSLHVHHTDICLPL